MKGLIGQSGLPSRLRWVEAKDDTECFTGHGAVILKTLSSGQALGRLTQEDLKLNCRPAWAYPSHSRPARQ